MELIIQAEKIIEKLEQAGFEAYAVGGCVRDSLLGTEPEDFDIATSALPGEVEEVFQGERLVKTGIKHGTVTLVFEGSPFEITTFRVDHDYQDRRHPSKVEFTKSIEKDLARRDFTVNAMAYNERCGMIDPFGGREDIKAGVLRAVGDPRERFNEDALRIMRALRFSSTFGFEIESLTREALFENKELLKNVSAERVSSEFIKLICGKNASRVVTEYVDVLGVMLPELLKMKGFDQRNPHHVYNVLEHTAAVLENVPPKAALRLAALFHDIGKPRCFTLDENGIGHFYGHAEIGAEMTEKISRSLKLDFTTEKEVVSLVKWHMVQIEPTQRAVKRALNKLTPGLFFELIELKRGDALGCGTSRPIDEEYYSAIERIARDILEQGQCFSLRNLAVNGSDLIAAGMEPGRELGKVLSELLEKVLNDELPNEKETLLDFAKRKLNNAEN